MGSNSKITEIYVVLEDGRRDVVRIQPSSSSDEEVRAAFVAAGSAEEEADVKLYCCGGEEIHIGRSLPPNSAERPYRLDVRRAIRKPPNSRASDCMRCGMALRSRVATSTAVREIMEDDDFLRRLSTFEIDEATKQQLRKPECNANQWEEWQLAPLLEFIFADLGIVEHFKIDRLVLRRFIHTIQINYEDNPFHNYRHGFCVAQMMYCLIVLTGLSRKFTMLEQLSLLVACIAHDLNHQGLTNSYHINAETELALKYNDHSPLENHHASLCFWILRSPDTNVAQTLSAEDLRQFRRLVIQCILSTDHALHAQSFARFNAVVNTGLSFDNSEHRLLLLQWIVKCSDISNEVRPKEFAEDWANRLQAEFAEQYRREQAEGLPSSSCMDPNVANKPDSQISFIEAILLPTFEILSLVVPNLEGVLQSIKAAKARYAAMRNSIPILGP